MAVGFMDMVVNMIYMPTVHCKENLRSLWLSLTVMLMVVMKEQRELYQLWFIQLIDIYT